MKTNIDEIMRIIAASTGASPGALDEARRYLETPILHTEPRPFSFRGKVRIMTEFPPCQHFSVKTTPARTTNDHPDSIPELQTWGPNKSPDNIDTLRDLKVMWFSPECKPAFPYSIARGKKK